MPAKQTQPSHYPVEGMESMYNLLRFGACRTFLITQGIICWISEDVPDLLETKGKYIEEKKFESFLVSNDRKKFRDFSEELLKKGKQRMSITLRTGVQFGKRIVQAEAICLNSKEKSILLKVGNLAEPSALKRDPLMNPALLKSVYEGIDSALFLLEYTPGGEFIFLGLNPAHERVSGMKSIEVEGKTPMELYPLLPLDACKAVQANYQKCVDAGESIQYEEMIPMKGKNIWWLTRLTPLRDSNGRIYRIAGSTTDITEQKASQKLLSFKNEEILSQKEEILAQKEEIEKLYKREARSSRLLDSKLKEKTADLMERIKELRCLFEIDQYSIEENFREKRFLLKSGLSIKNGLLHPDKTEVKIEVGELSITTKMSIDSEWVLTQPIKFHDVKGKIQINYTGKSSSNPFLQEEKEMIKSIAVKVGRVISTNRMMKDLQTANQNYRELNDNYQKQNQSLIEINEQINEEISKRKQREHEIDLLNRQFYTILDNFPEVLYVTDPETYEVLFVNKSFRELLGQDPIGKKCYEEFQGFKNPCPFCTNEIILKKEHDSYTWEHHNPLINKHFIITDQLIKWPDGRDVRFEFAMDISQLREAEYKYSRVLKTSIDGFWITDIHGVIQEVNEAYAKMIGIPVDRLKGMKIANIEVDQDEEMIRKRIETLKKNGFLRFETRHKKADGSIMDAEISATFSRKENGEIVVFIRDITQRKEQSRKLQHKNQEYYSLLEEFKSQNEELRTTNESLEQILSEKELVESELRNQMEFNQKIFNDSPMGLGVYNQKGQCLRTNPKSAEMIGATVDQVLSQNFLHIKSWEISGLKDAALQVLQNGGTQKKEISTVSSFKKEVHIECSFTRFYMNEEPHILFIYNDISDKRMAEKELRKSEKKYSSLFQSMNEGVAIHTFVRNKAGKICDYRIVEVNPSFEKILGIKRNEVLNKTATEAYSVPVAPYLDIYSRIEETHEAIQFEDYFAPMDKYFSIGVYSPGKDLFATIFTDITEKKKATLAMKELNQLLEEKIKLRTRELEESNAKLRNLNAELESFSYSVSHDLRTPLRAIAGYSTILKEDFYEDLPEEAKETLDTIIRNSEKMGILIDEILSFSRLNRQDVNLKRLNIERIFKDVYQDLKSPGPERIVEFNLAELPVAYGDEIMVRQVVSNLLSNALKYTSKNEKALIDVSGERNGDFVEFCVKDNGVGFNKDYYNKLFGVFQRLHSDRQFPGTGVGLAFAKRIIEKHNGRIWADSSPGKGAEFYFSLPAKKE